MKIVLTEQESEQYFYDAMCNGLNELAYYDLELDYNENEFSNTKHKLGVASPGIMICYEDILMEMLREGKSLWIVDVNEDERFPITLQLVHERVQETPHNHLMDSINERGDATTADCILQTVIYGEVIYG
jgi:hypothetical protein